MKLNIRILKIAYSVTIAVLLATVVCTPFLVTHKNFLSEKFIVEEDAVEAFLIIALLFTAYFVSRLYRSELRKSQKEMERLTCSNKNLSDRLSDAFHYIGGVNVQIQEIRSISSGLNGYPVSKNDMKNIFDIFARKILDIANVDWVVIRIINRTNFRTLTEHIEFRKHTENCYKHVSNKAIISKQNVDGYLIVASHQENSTIKGVCILPNISLDHVRRIIIEAIVNQVEMLYIIFTSQRLSTPPKTA